MVRAWTEEETNVLREYIDSHLGHSNGLSGSYWDELSHGLESVRRTGDPVLKKTQVTNKIVLFGKKQVSCSHILQYGTADDKSKRSKTCKEQSKPKVNHIGSASTSRTELHISESLVKQPLMAHNDIQTAVPIEKDIVADSVLPVSRESEHHLKRKMDPRTPLRSDKVGVSPYGGSSSRKSRSCTSVKRAKFGGSSKASTYGQKKKRSNRTEKIIHKRLKVSVQNEQAVKVPIYSSNHSTGQSSYYVSAPMSGNTRQSPESSKGVTESDTLSPVDMKISSVWQDQMLYAWEKFLSHQNDIDIIQQEPVDRREVLFTIEDIWNRVNEASQALQEMFPKVFDVLGLGPSGTQILSTLTGFKSRSEMADHLRVAQSLPPLSITANLLRAFVGATIHQWVFDGFRTVSSGGDHHDASRNLFDNFIQRECPKFWTSYQSLYYHQSLSLYNEETILTEAKRMSNDIYVLLSAACSTTKCIYTSPNTGDSTFSNSFPIQAQYYQTFKNNTTEAYRLALGLRIALAKCSDLAYEFHFPKMNDNFDASCMEVKNLGSDECTVGDEDRSIAVCLLPSIWSRARRDSEYGKSSTLVTKAIVLL